LRNAPVGTPRRPRSARGVDGRHIEDDSDRDDYNDREVPHPTKDEKNCKDEKSCNKNEKNCNIHHEKNCNNQQDITEIKILFGNIQSIMPKMDELLSIAKHSKYDIIALNETWLDMNGKHLIAEISIPNYKMFYVDKPTPTKRGGGSIMYVRDYLNPIIKRTTATNTSEIIHLEIQPQHGTIIKIVLIYRKTTIPAALDDIFYSQLEDIVTTNHETVIMGDFNLPNIDWTTLQAPAPGNKLLNFVNDNNLRQHVLQATRQQNILDLVISTEIDLIQNVCILDKLGDHQMIEFEIKCLARTTEINRYNYDFRRANFDALCDEVDNHDFEELFENRNAEECFILLKNKILEASRTHIPQKKINMNRPSWLNNAVLVAISNRLRAYKENKQNPSEATERLFTANKRQVKRILKTSKRKKEKEVSRIAKTNPKRFYAYVNERRIIRESIGPLLDTEGDLRTTDQEMATVMNNYFSSVFTRERLDNIPAVDEVQQLPHVLENINFRTQDVQEQLVKLNIYKSTGPDLLHPRILRVLSEIISLPMAVIMNQSMTTGVVPGDWRTANVTAIHKKADKQNPGNYRPISLTSVAGKTMERMIKTVITSHLETNNLLKNTQHGFRNKRSCLSNLLDFFGRVTEIYDQEKAVDLIYLDFQKAFDKVPHERLMRKVEAHGIIGNVSQWIRNWLSNRKQRVSINSKTSEWAPVTSGVPQGSVLGPLLFIIYINDLDNEILSKISKFADDTKLCHRALTVGDQLRLQNDLNKLVEWADKWQMNFNVDKCTVVHLGCHNREYNYTMGGNQLAEVEQQRDLGIIINKDLKWDKQVETSYKKAMKALGLIARNFHYKSKDIMLPLYTSLVRPHLEFAVQFWSPHLRRDIIKLEKIQHKATKMIPELRNKQYPARLEELQLTTLERRRLRGQLIETFKYLKGFTRASPTGLFDLNDEPRNRNNGQKLIVKRFNTSVAENFFPIKIANVWNRLPSAVVNCNTVNAFKNNLDKHWQSHPPPF
jgi:hypothetical protein